MNREKPRLRVVAAVAIRDGRVLVARRLEDAAFAGMWEFPGGKVEPGETDEGALRRELREELDVEATAGVLIATNSHEYADRIVDLFFYFVRLTGTEPRPLGCSELRWIEPADTGAIPFLDGDARFLESLRAPGALERWSS